MQIGIDATSWFNGRGYGRFTRELLRELFEVGSDHQFLLFVEAQNAAGFGALSDNVEVCSVDCGGSQTEAAASDGYRAPRDLLRFTAAVRRERPDVFLFPTVYTYFPLPRSTRAVVAIHDTIAERFPELTLPNWRARLFWRLKVWLAIRQSTMVLTVSDYSARDLAERFGIGADRLRVTSEAPSSAYSPGVTDEERARVLVRYGLSANDTWFTYVGGFNPHKRVDTLIRAHAALAAEMDAPPQLLLVGTIDKDVFHGCREDLLAQIEDLGTAKLVRWTGFVPDEDLRVLHALALACVLPSECEGFGLPAVEAAACGTPVIATIESPLPEVLEGGGFFVAPGDDAGLLAAMRTLAGDSGEREGKGQRALERANALSWRRSAEVTLRALEEAAA